MVIEDKGSVVSGSTTWPSEQLTSTIADIAAKANAFLCTFIADPSFDLNERSSFVYC
jgi:hypothetical protein